MKIAELGIKTYDKRPKESEDIRVEVFTNEQGFKDVCDEIDEVATHLLVFDGEEAVATCRYFWEEERNAYVAGRIAVKKTLRGQNIGGMLLKEVERQIKEKGKSSLHIHSQYSAKGFYEKQGFVSEGEVEYEQNCPHIWMIKEF